MARKCWLLLVLLLAVGCGDDGPSDPSGEGSGTNPPTDPTLTVRLTDAPGDLAHAWVEITGITLEGEDDNEEVVSTTVFSGSTGDLDLLALEGVTTDLVVNTAVAAGSYDRMRVDFGSVVVETLDGLVIALPGSSHPDGATVDVVLECSTCDLGNPNVKLPSRYLDLDSGSTTLILDFDVNQSFGRWPGEPDRWFFRPAIYAVDASSYGSIAGTVTLDNGVSLPTCGGQVITLESFTILAYDAADAARSGRTRADGTYVIDYVVPGRYGMRFDQVVGFEDQELIFNAVNPGAGFPIQVVVEAGAVSTMDYLVNLVQCDDRTSAETP